MFSVSPIIRLTTLTIRALHGNHIVMVTLAVLPALVVNHFDNQCSICLSPPKPKYNERFARPSTMVFIEMYIYVIVKPSRKPQHSKWNCVGTTRPRHIHMNAPKIPNRSKNIISEATKFEFESAN